MPERLIACAAWQEDLAGWLMAQVPPEREARLVEHLAVCPACREESESLLGVSAVSLATDPDAEVVGSEEVPPDLGDRIVGTISTERRRRRLARAGLVALASAAAAVAVVVVVQRDTAPMPLHGDEVAFTVMPPGARVDATIAEDDLGSIVQLAASGLDPDVTYALWLSPPKGAWDDRVAAGTFRPDAHGAVDVRLRCALPADAYGRIWATTPDGTVALDTE